MKKLILLLLVMLCVATAKPDEIVRAMKEELERSILGLKIEDYQSPFYMAYTYRDMNIIKIRSVLGGTVLNVSSPYGVIRVAMKIGDYGFSGDHFSIIIIYSAHSGRIEELPEIVIYGD